MSDYASTSDVEALLGGRSLDGSAIVSTAQAQAWLNEAERELIGTIAAAGGSTDYTADTTHALLIIRHWVATYTAARVRRAIAGAAGDSDNDDGQTEIDGWRELLTAIRTNPLHYVNMLGNSASTSIAGIRTHAVAADSETAEFKMTEKF